MKTAFSRKLMAILVAALMITALTVVFATIASAANNPGVTITDETFDEVGRRPSRIDYSFDLELEDGYMIDDPDLHDGYVPVDFTVYLKTTERDNSTTLTPLYRQTTGEYEGLFLVTDYDEDTMDIVVTDVSAIARTIDGKTEEDFVFEADGHIYTLNNAALYGHVVVLNGQTDYTKVANDNAEIDLSGKIMVPDSAAYLSYAPAISATGYFSNYGTLEFLNATGMNNANRAIKQYFYNNTESSGTFVNHGTINVNTRDIFFLCRTFTNSETGVLNVGNAVSKASDNTGRFYIICPTDRSGLLNSGEINLDRGDLYVGGTFVLPDTSTVVYDSNFTNDASVKSCGTLTVTGTFKNTKNGTVELYSKVWTNAITGAINAGGLDAAGNYLGAQATGKLNLTGVFNMQEAYADAPYAHVNNGTIVYDDDYIARGGYFFNNSAQFTNNGTMLFKTSFVAQSGADGSAWDTNYAQIRNLGKIVNNGTFTVEGYRFKFFTNANNYNIELSVPFATVSKLKAVKVMPLGIENNGDMTVVDHDNAGTIVNNGNFTLNGLLNSGIAASHIEDMLVYDNCGDCPGHTQNVECWTVTGNFENYGLFTNNAEGRFTDLYNEGTIDNNAAIKICHISENRVDFPGYFNNVGTLNNIGVSSSLINYGFTETSGLIESEGSITNYGDMFVDEDGIVNSARFENLAVMSIEDQQGFGISTFLTVAGEFNNNGTFLNDWYCDLRVEGTFNNVDGMLTNKGMVVNVGSFTTTEDGIDNQFAFEGYDLTYVNKADTQAPADDTTKAPADTTKAPADTKAPTKTPAAQTSDVAVAGFAILATLALAGVVVAKKVR